ncbi:MAG: hypothetical protein ACK526_22255 [Planctomyces sp.]
MAPMAGVSFRPACPGGATIEGYRETSRSELISVGLVPAESTSRLAASAGTSPAERKP